MTWIILAIMILTFLAVVDALDNYSSGIGKYSWCVWATLGIAELIMTYFLFR